MADTRLVLLGLLLVVTLPPPLAAQPGASNETYLLLTNSASVFVLNMSGEVQHKWNDTSSYQLDFDPFTAKVFWPDRTQLTINSAFINGSQRTVLHQLPAGSHPPCVAVDYLLNLVFYSNNIASGYIGVMDTDGGSHRIVRNLTSPNTLAVDVIHEVLYYTDQSPSWNIGRMAYNGSNHEVLYSNVEYAHGLALDVRGGRLYWGSWNGSLESSALDGTDRTLVLAGQGQLEGLFFFEGVLFFTARNVTSIFSVRVNGTDRRNLTVDEPPHFFDVAVYSKSQAITPEEKRAALAPTASTTATTTGSASGSSDPAAVVALVLAAFLVL